MALELVGSIGPAFDCDIDIETTDLRTLDLSRGKYSFVSIDYSATGLRCREAAKVLDYRGRPRGLRFRRVAGGGSRQTDPHGRSYDLIHDVNPPIEQ